MATISRDIAKTIIENNGYYPGDPRCYSIHTYVNDWEFHSPTGKLDYHMSMNASDQEALYASPYCHDVRKVWDHQGLTVYGRRRLLISGGEMK